MDMKRRKRSREIATEIATEINRVLGPIMPEMLATKNDVIQKVFGDAFDRHGVSEAEAEIILSYVPGMLAANNAQFADLHRKLDAAITRPMP
jgi:hypothetical protein